MGETAAMLIAYWPVLAVSGAGLVAWGRVSKQIEAVEKDLDTKASKEVVERVETRLTAMDLKLDRLVEKL